jgi:hypothetical protein
MPPALRLPDVDLLQSIIYNAPMIKKRLSISLVLLLTVIAFSTCLIASHKKSGIGVYLGWSFPMDEGFDWRGYRYKDSILFYPSILVGIEF